MAQSRPIKTDTTKRITAAQTRAADTTATLRTRSRRATRSLPGGPAAAEPKGKLKTNAAPANAKPETTALDAVRSEPAHSSRAMVGAVAQTSGEVGGSKQARVVAMLRCPQGATIAELMGATGWLSHSVRGAISGVLKGRLGLVVENHVEPGRGRVYRIGTEPVPITPSQKPPQRRTRAPRDATGAGRREGG